MDSVQKGESIIKVASSHIEFRHVYIACMQMLQCIFGNFICRFEAFNSTIRGMNVHRNRHASSLDICTKIAKMERLRFVLSGGKRGKNHR